MLTPKPGACAALCALAATPLACAAPPAGIHVVITMDDAEFSRDHLFDHLTVRAQVGSRSAAACLFPADAVTQQLELDSPSLTACADLREQRWTGPPDAGTWALAQDPREINIEAEDGELVRIEVNGGFGSRLGVVTGSGEQTATAGYPELRIALTRGEPTFPSSCEPRLELAVPDDFDSKYRLCEANRVKCPEKFPASLLRSSAVYCVEGEISRLRNAPGLTCGQETGSPTVWHTPPIPAIEGETGCVRIFVSARFARCKEGSPTDPAGCTVTTDCAPRSVRLWTHAGQIDGPVLSDVALDCVPPTIVPITWSLPLQVITGQVVVGLSQSVDTADEGACFLDIESIAATSSECSQ